MNELPPEIWIYIAQFIPRDQLQRMISVNRIFFELAMDDRYRHASLTRLNPSDFVATMMRFKDPMVAKRVRSLQIWPCALQRCRSIKTRKSSRVPPSGVLANSLCFLKNSILSSNRTMEDRVTREHEGPFSVDQVKQAFVDTVAQLTRVTEYQIQSDRDDDRSFLPLLATVWPVFGHQLRVLSIHMPLSQLCTVISSAGGLERLEELDIMLPTENYPLSESKTYIETLGPFINGFSPTLRFLTISSSAYLDFSGLLDNLAHFPILIKLAILIPFDQVHLPDASSFSRLLRRNNTIRHLVLRPRICGMPSMYDYAFSVIEHRINDGFADVFLPGLHTMEIGLKFLPGTLKASMAHIGRFSDTLSSLTLMDLSLTYRQVEMVIGPFADCSSTALKNLSLFVRTFNPQLMVLLASKLPELKKLNLSIEVVSNSEEGSDAAVTSLSEFIAKMQQHDFTHWALYDVAITQYVYGIGSRHRWSYMEALATCIPTIKSFAGQGNKLVPP